MLGELTPVEVEDLLHTELVARIGCHGNGMVYVVPISYAYDGEALYGHSRDGLKLRLMRRNPHVCVEVDRLDDLANLRSVIAWGTFEELHGYAAQEGMTKLIERFSPLTTSETARPGDQPDHRPGHGEAPPPIVYRIVLQQKTGRFERG